MTEAENSSGKKRRRGAAAREARNRAIVAEFALGRPVDQIAARHAVSERTVRRITAAGVSLATEVPASVFEADASESLALVLHGQQVALRHGILLLEAGCDSSSAAVGAIRAVATASTALRDTLKLFGITEPGIVPLQAAVMRAYAVVRKLAETYDLPPDEVDAAIRSLPMREAVLIATEFATDEDDEEAVAA